mmetsp:Transcript_30408/g.50322  ORF Transcript_30408/g.50322 Transcript_30408/m.50322 type:complete len:262 (+) Transcript_30408:553-1338(+)
MARLRYGRDHRRNTCLQRNCSLKVVRDGCRNAETLLDLNERDLAVCRQATRVECRAEHVHDDLRLVVEAPGASGCTRRLDKPLNKAHAMVIMIRLAHLLAACVNHSRQLLSQLIAPQEALTAEAHLHDLLNGGHCHWSLDDAACLKRLRQLGALHAARVVRERAEGVACCLLGDGRHHIGTDAIEVIKDNGAVLTPARERGLDAFGGCLADPVGAVDDAWGHAQHVERVLDGLGLARAWRSSRRVDLPGHQRLDQIGARFT